MTTKFKKIVTVSYLVISTMYVANVHTADGGIVLKDNTNTWFRYFASDPMNEKGDNICTGTMVAGRVVTAAHCFCGMYKNSTNKKFPTTVNITKSTGDDNNTYPYSLSVHPRYTCPKKVGHLTVSTSNPDDFAVLVPKKKNVKPSNDWSRGPKLSCSLPDQDTLLFSIGHGVNPDSKADRFSLLGQFFNTINSNHSPQNFSYFDGSVILSTVDNELQDPLSINLETGDSGGPGIRTNCKTGEIKCVENFLKKFGQRIDDTIVIAQNTDLSSLEIIATLSATKRNNHNYWYTSVQNVGIVFLLEHFPRESLHPNCIAQLQKYEIGDPTKIKN